jgi:hypothetical protein
MPRQLILRPAVAPHRKRLATPPAISSSSTLTTRPSGRVVVHDVVDARAPRSTAANVAAAASVISMNDQIPVPPSITDNWRFRTPSTRESEAPGP